MRVHLDDKFEEGSILDAHAHVSSALERVFWDREEAPGVRCAEHVLQGEYGLNLKSKRFHFQSTP